MAGAVSSSLLFFRNDGLLFLPDVPCVGGRLRFELAASFIAWAVWRDVADEPHPCAEGSAPTSWDTVRCTRVCHSALMGERLQAVFCRTLDGPTSGAVLGVVLLLMRSFIFLGPRGRCKVLAGKCALGTRRAIAIASCSRPCGGPGDAGSLGGSLAHLRSPTSTLHFRIAAGGMRYGDSANMRVLAMVSE